MLGVHWEWSCLKIGFVLFSTWPSWKKTMVFITFKKKMYFTWTVTLHILSPDVIPTQRWMAPVTRWLSALCNLSPANNLSLGGKLSFFSLNSGCGKCAWVLCPWGKKKKRFWSVGAWVGDKGGRWSQKLECAGRKSQKWGYLNSPPSLTSLLLCFLLLLFLIKGKRDDGARNEHELPEVYASAHVLRRLSVSASLGLSFVTPLTPQEALDVSLAS